MIQFADDQTKPQVWDMWKTVFGDSDEYMELYFRHKYRSRPDLLLYMEGEAVSSQMLPYWFSFCGKEIPVLYLIRSMYPTRSTTKRLHKAALLRSFRIIKNRISPHLVGTPRRVVVSFYGKYDFVQTFDAE